MMTMAEIEYTLADLIRFSSDQKPIEFGNAFQSIMQDKVSQAINDRKLSIAQSLYNNQQEEDDVELELDDEGSEGEADA
jgi:hypothetical protein